MPSRSLAAMISLGIGALSALRVALVWDRLPERMASHYGASGEPNGFMMRGDFFVFYAGIYGLVITLFLAMPSVLSRIPRELVNIPHREYWLVDERWPEALDRTGRWMAWFGVAMTVFAAGVLQLVLRSNLMRAPLENGPMWVLLGGFFAFTGIWLAALYRAFRPPA
jgi:uncharacterized membrane protein